MSTTEGKVKIESGIPVPEAPYNSTVPPLPLADMKVGDSVAVTLKNEKEIGTVRQRLYRFCRDNPPKRFSLRKMGEGGDYRVFRVKNAKK